MKKMINIDFVKYENNKSDEYIRLDTTIIGIDNLISKASSAEEANALFKAKDVIYSQQWYFDVTVEAEPAQSVHQGTWLFNTHTEVFSWKCSKCNYDTVARFNYCPSCGTKMDGDNNG